MTLTRIFQSGNSQAVQLPKEFRFDVDQVEIFSLWRRDSVACASSIFDALTQLPGDFMEGGRNDTPP